MKQNTTHIPLKRFCFEMSTYRRLITWDRNKKYTLATMATMAGTFCGRWSAMLQDGPVEGEENGDPAAFRRRQERPPCQPSSVPTSQMVPRSPAHILKQYTAVSQSELSRAVVETHLLSGNQL